MAQRINNSLAAAGFTTKKVPDKTPSYHNSGIRKSAKSLAAVVLVLGLFVQSVPFARAIAVDSPSNPPLGESCGRNIVLVLDSSDSMSDGDLATVKSAATTLVDALMPSTPTNIGVIDFDSNVISSLNPTLNKTDVLNAVNSIGHTDGPLNEHTNWDAALQAANPMVGSGDLVIIITDGNPTDSQGSDPLNDAVASANSIKNGNSRILAVGINSSGTLGGLNQGNLELISGPNVKTFPPDTITNINDVDVALGDISSLSSVLADLTTALCGGKIFIHKILDSDGKLGTPGDQGPGIGWQFTVDNSQFVTDSDGFIELDDVAAGSHSVGETLKDGFTFLSASCKEGDNTVGTLDGHTVFAVPLGDQDIVNCTFYNQPPQVDEGTTFHFIKQICDSYSDIAGNGKADEHDATKGQYIHFTNYSGSEPHFPATYDASDASLKPIDPSEIPDGCHPAAGWSFNLYASNPDDGNPPVVTTVGPTDGDGTADVALADLPASLQTLVNQHGSLWVAEVMQPDEATFGALRCYNDALNGDNSEFIKLTGSPESFPDDVYCIAYNVKVSDGGPCVQSDLLVNGSFEAPLVSSDDDWRIAASGAPGLGWTVDWTGVVPATFDGDSRPDPANLELQKSVNGWLPSDGAQYAELDSDWEGPAGDTSGEPANVSISQEVATELGTDYKLSFDFSPRPGVASNVVEVYWNGSLVDTISEDGSLNSANMWTGHEYTLPGDDGSSTLEFREVGSPDSLGSFLDNVKLINQCPESGGGRFTLTITTDSPSSEGNGVVTASGINCDTNAEEDDCSETFEAGTPVTVTATPDEGSSFDGSWATILGDPGNCTGNTTPCQVTMNSNITLNAHFSLNNGGSSGGSSSGNRTSSSSGSSGNGSVLGDSIQAPLNPRVEGAVTALPVTGLPVDATVLLLLLAGSVIGKLLIPKKS